MNFLLKIFVYTFFCFSAAALQAQMKWVKVDSVNTKLPKGLTLYYSNDSLDGKPNIAYYLEADLKNKHLQFEVDTTMNRRLTPEAFYVKNNHPLVVVNGTFFSFQTNQNLNVVIKKGKVVAHNIAYLERKGRDSIIRRMPVNRSAIGISKKRKADIAWIKTDSAKSFATANQLPVLWSSSTANNDLEKESPENLQNLSNKKSKYHRWKMQTAIGGGPVLVQNNQIQVTNEFERMFTGKGLTDKHPRTAMGYTKDHKLIILVIQGRFPNLAEGASLVQEADILKNIGCVEALNLDGGGSSCMLINGNQTIQPSDKTGQRPTPAIFMIKVK